MASHVRTLCAIACAAVALAVPARSRAASCSFSSNGIAFGAYDPTSPATVRVAASIAYGCSASTYAVILFDGGSANDVTRRTMTSGPEKLAYNVFKDANASSIWGDTWGTGLILVLSTSGSVPVYGSLPPRQDVAPGLYGDTLTVTILFM